MGKKARTYTDKVAALGCVVCRNLCYGASPAHVHHIRTGQGMAQRAQSALIIPLCPEHHTGGNGIHTIGKSLWERTYGTELELLSQTILETHND